MPQALKTSADFLSFTLAQPHSLDEAFQFTLSSATPGSDTPVLAAGSVPSQAGDTGSPQPHTRVEVWDTGVIMFEPMPGTGDESQPSPSKEKIKGKDIVLSCAVHGNETAPIELCNGWITQLLQQTIITQQRLLFIFGNPPAIVNGSRFIDENLNRLFNGAHSLPSGLINPERNRAQKLESYVARFFGAGNGNADKPRQRIHYDLHTAIRGSKHEKFAIYPYRPGRHYSAEQIMFLEACGINTVLFHHEATTTFSYFSSENFHADAFTIELGKVMPMGENDMMRFIALNEMIRRLITDRPLGLAPFDSSKLNLYQVSRSINKGYDDFEFTFASDVENFTAFPKGYILAKEGGNNIKVEHDIEAIVFPNDKVPVGQRTVLCLVPADTENIV